MRYEIIFAPEAVSDLQELRANVRAEVLEAIERHLRHEPTKTSKARIKRLRGLSSPEFRLRVGDDIRVLYDVHEDAGLVEILAVLTKSELKEWLLDHGEGDESSTV